MDPGFDAVLVLGREDLGVLVAGRVGDGPTFLRQRLGIVLADFEVGLVGDPVLRE